MSDAIVLDVADTTPVRLDVGDADPIAREEIAELATRVTTVEGDVSGLSTRVGAAENALSTLGTTVDGIDARVEAIEADGSVTPAKLADTPFPSLIAGAARSLTGDEPTEATFLDRACPGTTGQATIQSVKGNTVVQDGSLLPVRMEGIETVGFNQWDEQWEVGTVSASTGELVANDGRIRSKNYVPVFPNTTYFHKTTARVAGDVAYYDEGKNYVGGSVSFAINHEFTTPANARYMKFSESTGYGATYKHDICINLSDPARNGTYEPHWSSQRTIPAATYFPQGMRSAGTVYDELRADEAITRVGERAYQSGDESDPTVVTNGTITHYALATPTTTPIDPPLNMTYRAEHGGTERITHTEQSAPPVLSIAYGHTAEGIVQEAASAIAAQDGPKATANHAVGSYLTMGGKLYRVTTAIATGEAITPGTNVMATTVMAEVLSLIQ